MAPPSSAQTSTPLGDNSALAREATGWLADLIKINTTNPPGNEEAAAKYVAAILQKEGITAELLPLAPGRSALVARLKNSAFSDPSKALLLVAHLDEVGASDASIRVLISKYWDKVAAKYAINEGGNVFVKNGKVQYVAVQASEKVAVNVTVTANGKSGHASIPLRDNAVTHLCAAVEKIAGYTASVHFTTIVRRYFEGIAPLQDDEISKWIRSLDTADRGEHAARVISDSNPIWNAMLRDTISPTMLSAGARANVIPSVATATLNIRLLPGNTITALLCELNKIVNDPQVKLEVQPDAGLTAPDSSLESDC